MTEAPPTAPSPPPPKDSASRLWNARLAVLLVLLAGAALLKTQYDPIIGRKMADGSYYLQLAQHLRDGDGLVSHVSLYFQGFKEFPHKVNQAPLWPALLGYGGRLTDIDWLATQLPEFLYLLDLLLVYFVGRRLWERTGGDGYVLRRDRVFDFGHVAVVLLGLNPLFFRFTSLPYTEGLAFAFGLAAFLAVDRADTRRDPRWAIGAGLLAGLALLTRAQMLGIALGVPLALLLPRLRTREGAKLFAAASAGIAVVMLPWLLYLSTWLEPLGLRTAIGLAEFSETPELLPFQPMKRTDGFVGLLQDRAWGAWLAFAPTGLTTYFRQLGWAIYLIPTGLLYLAVTIRQDPTGLRRASRSSLLWAMLIAAVVMLGPVHMSHQTFFREWLFGHRHGIPLLFVALPLFAMLDRSKHGIVPVVTAAGIALGVSAMSVDIRSATFGDHVHPLRPSERELIEWLNAQDPPLTVISTKVQLLAPFTRSGLHWVTCNTPPEQTIAMLEHAGADYVIAYWPDRACPFIDGRRYRWHPVIEFGTRQKILVLSHRPVPRGDRRRD